MVRELVASWRVGAKQSRHSIVNSLAPLGPGLHGLKHERVVGLIVDAIRSGAFSVGDRLPSERTLAAEIGVSRAIVGAAIDELEASGVVEVRRGRGGGTFLVSSANIPPGPKRLAVPDDQVVRWLLEVRAPAETAMLKLAAERAQLSDVRDLQRLHGRLTELIGDPRAFSETGFTLLIRIAETTRNPFFIEIARGLINEQAKLRFNLEGGLDRRTLHVLVDTIGGLIDALVSGDGDEIDRAVATHMQATREAYLGGAD